MEELSAPSKVPAGVAAMAEKETARPKIPPTKASDNFFNIECLMIVLLLNLKSNSFIGYNYITNMLKVKEIVAEWGIFGKIARISREKWFPKGKNVLKMVNSKQRKVSKKGSKVEMNSPVYDKIEDTKNTGRIIPIYPTTYKLPQTTLRRVIETGIHELEGNIEETLPEYLVSEYKLLDLDRAVNQIHFPNSFDDFNLAKKRLVFEELLSMQLALLALKNQYTKDVKGIEFSKDAKM